MFHSPDLRLNLAGTFDHELFEEALRAVRLHLGMPISYLSIFEGDTVRFLNVSSDLDDPFLKTGDVSPAEGTYCQAVRDGLLPELLPDTSQNSYARSLAITQKAPIGAVVSIPIRHDDGNTIGMFCCLSQDPRPKLTIKDHQIMTLFAGLVSKIVRDQQQKRLQRRKQRQAIKSLILGKQFDLKVQPIVELATGTIRSAEALCRFHPTPYKTPDKWFAEAQECGFGIDLEIAVMKEAIDLIAQIPEPVSLSINLSPNAVLSDYLLPAVSGVPNGRLVIELTEHTTFQNMERLRHRIAELRTYGIWVALDDLGTGYSSLSTVLELRPDVVKLDRSLIENVDTDPASQSLTTAILKFSLDLGAKVVAEGVERREQVQMLRALGVPYAQGYYFAKPDDVESLPAQPLSF